MGSNPAPFTATHFDGPTGQWLAWVYPWAQGNPLGKGQTEVEAKEHLAAQMRNAEK